MSRIAFSLLFVATILFFWMEKPSHAAGSDPVYIVNDVPADATDESSVKARNKAFAEAQTNAFKILAGRLGQTVTATGPDLHILSSLVRDFEIKNEQLSSKRYRGTYSFRFKKEAVNRYFGITAVPEQTESAYQSTAPGKILVLPFITTKTVSILWDKTKNEYWNSLKDRTKDSHISYPEGTVLDKTDVWEKNPSLLSMSSIRKIRERYGVDQVMVAVLREGEDKKSWMVDLYRTDRNRVELVRTLPVSLLKTSTETTLFTNAADATILGLDRFENEGMIAADIAGEETPQQDIPSYSPTSSSLPETEEKALPVEVSPVENAASMETAPVTGTVRVIAELGSLRDWTTLQGLLRGSAELSEYKIVSMKTSEADLEFSAQNWKKGVPDLEKSGYIVTPSLDGTYRLYRY